MNDAEGRLKNQSEMLAAVAHDLRHTLFRAGLYLDLARDENDNGRRKNELREIVDALSTLARLVEDLDDFGSLQSGRLRVSAEPIDVLDIIDATQRAFGPLARSHSITLASSTSTGPCIAGDRVRLIQAYSNLIGNALCHTPRGGMVHLSTYPDGDAVCFAVSDTGPGIKTDDLPHLFERYWRCPGARYPGRGLGLAIARGIIEQHRGRIWAENNAMGGATFSFTIPRQRPSASTA